MGSRQEHNMADSRMIKLEYYTCDCVCLVRVQQWNIALRDRVPKDLVERGRWLLVPIIPAQPPLYSCICICICLIFLVIEGSGCYMEVAASQGDWQHIHNIHKIHTPYTQYVYTIYLHNIHKIYSQHMHTTYTDTMYAQYTWQLREVAVIIWRLLLPLSIPGDQFINATC